MEDLNETYAKEMQNMEDAKQRIREKVLVKLGSTVFGIAFAGGMAWYMGLFLFGVWSITEDGQACYAVEFPNTQ